MRITIAQLLLLLFVFTCGAREGNGQGVLERTISISVEKTKIRDVLPQIQKLADVKFIFSSGIINAGRRISFAADKEKLGELLNKVLRPLSIDYRAIDDNIILYSKDDSDVVFKGIPVHGKITDEKGFPLAGATVEVKGTTIKTVSDEKGIYVLDDVDPQAVLVISYVGYIDNEIPVNNKTELNIFLKAKENSMDQVIVIGYGIARKKDVVGSVSVISAKDAGANTATSPSQLLQGKAAGVQVVQTNGLPGSGAQIIIRGTGSFTSIDPLYVIDGIQGDINLFNSLNVQDIDNITILKDASATAIYGAAAANGVVIVTTKRAKSGSPKISFSSQVGIAKAWRQLDILKAKDYVDLVKDVAVTQGVQLPDKFNTPAVLQDSTDWQKAIFRKALLTDNHITISGGTDKFLYTFSTGYITQQSTVKDYSNNRLNLRINLEENIGRFKLGQTLNLRYTHAVGAVAGLVDAINMAPYKPILDPHVIGGYAIVSNVEDLNNAGNPLQAVNLSNPVTNEFIFYPQVYGEVGLIKGLRFRSQFSAKIGGSKSTNFNEPYTAANYLFSARGASQGYSDYSNYIFENFFSYNRTFGKHNVSATLGNSYIDPGNASRVNASGSNIANDVIRNISVALSQNVTGTSNGYASTALISYYGRLIYTYDNKYILSASMRRDGASNFGANNRYGNFPGVGVAWKFSEEDFIKSVGTVITDGKLRIGWGRTGNNNIPAFLTDAVTYGGDPSGNLVYSLGTNETFVPGITVNRIPNPNLKWEETDQVDAGIDLLFLNKLSLTVDWYSRKNKDLLVFVPLPTSNGIGGSGNVGSDIATNAATAQNKGLEITLGYTDKPNQSFSYNVSVNAAFNKNKVLSLGKEFLAPIRSGSFSSNGAFTYTATGYPIGSFYGYRVDHVAKDLNEIAALDALAAQKTNTPGATYQSGLLPGDFIFKDIDGDGQVTDKDQEILGNPMPKIVYGFNAGVNFKNFDLNIVLAGVSGLKLANALRLYTRFADKPHNSSTDILNRWKQPGDVVPLPRAGQNPVSNLRPSDFFLEDGSFLRLRNITIGYTIPATSLTRITKNVVSNLRIYIASENLFTITKYKGYDPEISTQGSNGNYIFQRGIDDGQLPQSRTFLFGLQVGF
ncbi:MAG: TonB-dependent receptor [Bacteroidota bacterium]